VYVIGDLNANIAIRNNQSKFGETLSKFYNDEGILMADYDNLPKSSTFLLVLHIILWADWIISLKPALIGIL